MVQQIAYELIYVGHRKCCCASWAFCLRFSRNRRFFDPYCSATLPQSCHQRAYVRISRDRFLGPWVRTPSGPLIAAAQCAKGLFAEARIPFANPLMANGNGRVGKTRRRVIPCMAWQGFCPSSTQIWSKPPHDPCRSRLEVPSSSLFSASLTKVYMGSYKQEVFSALVSVANAICGSIQCPSRPDTPTRHPRRRFLCRRSLIAFEKSTIT